MAETIYFNGKKYQNLSEMPSGERQMYEKLNRFFADANQDGIPDVLQGGGLSGLKETFGMLKEVAQMGSSAQGMTAGQISIVRETDTGIYVNGKGFGSIEEMPAEVRRVYEQVTANARESQTDIFDESWRETKREDFFTPHDDEVFNRQFPSQPVSTPSNPIETVDSNARLVLIIALGLLIIGGAVVAWMFLF